MYSLYKTTNLINNKIYVGVHDETITKPYLGSGIALKRAINKYGKESFIREIIIELDDKDEIYNLEEIVVDSTFIKRPDVYNMKEGGFGGSNGHTQETKDLISKGMIGEKNHLYGKKRPEHSKLMKERFTGSNNPMYGKTPYNKGIPMSEEQKKKISDSCKDTRTGEDNPFYGKTHSVESRKKISDANKIKIACPHCGKVGGYSIMQRWHFDNCKHKE